ncbi:MAG: phosphoribosylanthranilate isomerase [Pseudomonadales bacterium]|nr:phosphoribosylanthranilate isomerase [Gammaproteobacteria bacterium]NNL56976.1 phosphoribosylanthranilate isomerase [Pseudomonadales bacterium]
MNKTRIKICGLTRSEDIAAAIEAGADALGFVFYPPSPRALDIAQAAKLLALLPPFVTSVGLLVDPEPGLLQRIAGELPLSLLQFHGNEAPALCTSTRLPYIKAVRLPKCGVEPPVRAAAARELQQVFAAHQQASGFLLDTLSAAGQGGTGEQFDWSLLPAGEARPLVLAGGLDAGNVAAAVRAHRPYAVDVSSGVESAPGIKDAGKIENFVRAVQQVPV